MPAEDSRVLALATMVRNAEIENTHRRTEQQSKILRQRASTGREHILGLYGEVKLHLVLRGEGK